MSVTDHIRFLRKRNSVMAVTPRLALAKPRDRLALSLRPLAGLVQVQEPERAGGEAGGRRGLGQKEDNVTEEMPLEQAALVDVLRAPYVRPLGNLVVLFAQAEAAWLEFVIELIECAEKEAEKFVRDEATKVKQEVLTRVNASGRIGDGMRQQLCESIGNFFDDRERRHRLMHDEWYVSLVAESRACGRGV
jgi:hypothetical protein